MKAGLVIAAAWLCLVACSSFGGTAQVTPAGSPLPTALHPASGNLDAEVAMPVGFPSDVPIYTGARLTAGAQFTSPGQITWGMEWETLDGGPKVATFYKTKLDQGDWIVNSTSAPNPTTTAYSFSRKSNSHFAGTVGIDGSSGVTKISMSLVSPSG